MELKGHKDGQILQFIHQSVNDFLLLDGLKFLSVTSDQDVVGTAHHDMALVCVNYIRMVGSPNDYLDDDLSDDDISDDAF